MFEDIDDRRRSGRKPNSGGEDNDGPPEFGRNRRSGMPPGMEKEIAKFIEDKFGGRAKAVGNGILYSPPGGDSDPRKEIYNKLEGILKSMTYIAEELKLKPCCLDANKAELAVGDVLKCPGGEVKTVLKLGWKFAILSHTDNQTKEDGPWFEDEIDSLNFIKKV